MPRRPRLLRSIAAAVIGLPVLAASTLGSISPGYAGAAPAGHQSASHQPAAARPGDAPKRAEQPAPDDAPLLVSIDSITPSAVPDRGPVQVQGTITNRDDVAWTDIRLYPVLSSSELMTTAADLAAAAAAPADDYIGERILTVKDDVAPLAPGAETTFELTLSRSTLVAQLGPPGQRVSGVYQLGVQALGSSDEAPRDLVSDGRARTFLPLITRLKGALPTALVMPVRKHLSYEPDGSLSDPGAWHESLETGGRMREQVRFGAQAGARPITWLIDPAVPDAVRRISRLNPPRSLRPDEPVEGVPSEDNPPTPPTAEEGGSSPAPEPDAETVAAANGAQEWLDDLQSGVQGKQVLTLPYGDPDLEALSRNNQALYDVSRAQGSVTLQSWGVAPDPAVGAPSGYLSASGFSVVEPGTPVLMTDRAFGEDPPAAATATTGQPLIITSSAAAEGTPAAADPQSGVALRQRIISEAALRMLLPGRHAPLVVVLPPQPTSIGAGEFFAGFDLPWLELSTVADTLTQKGRRITTNDLTLPPRQQTFEVSAETFSAVDELISSGEMLQNLLIRNTRVAGAVTEQALASVSYSSRRSRLSTQGSITRSKAWLEDKIGAISISAPPGITLSGDKGDFVATISNKLDQPVTVGVVAQADSDIEITVPEAVELGPNSRTTVKLQATTTQSQVINVTLRLTDTDGSSIGATDEVRIRSVQVSKVIWVLLATGLVLLFGTIGLRLVRGDRRRGRTRATQAGEDGGHPAAEPTTGSANPVSSK